MKRTPIKKKIIKYLVLLYLLAVGSSSQKDIWSIMPAIRENRIPSFLKRYKQGKLQMVQIKLILLYIKGLSFYYLYYNILVLRYLFLQVYYA